MWHGSFYCFLNLPLRFSSSKGLLTQVYLLGLQAMFDQMTYLYRTAIDKIPFLPSFAGVPTSNICYLFRWSPHVPLCSSCPPHNPTQKEPLQPLLIIEKDWQGLALMTLPPSVSLLCQQTLWHEPCFLSGLRWRGGGSHEKYLRRLPSPCHTPDPPQS